MTDGLLVLVQEVIAAMTTAPCVISLLCPLFLTVPTRSRALFSSPKPVFPTGAVNESANDCFMSFKAMRS